MVCERRVWSSLPPAVAAVVAAVALGGVAGCPRAPMSGDTSGQLEGDTTPPLAGDPEAAPLGDPAEPDPDKDGLEYLHAVYPPLAAAWGTFLEDCRLRLPRSHELNNSDLATTVEVVIDARGRLHVAEIASPSGNPDFDVAALEIVRDAAPFSEPPADVVSDDGRVHLTWLFARDRRQAGPATAELHRVRWPAKRAVPALVEQGAFGQAAVRLLEEAQTLSPDQTMEAELLVGLFHHLAGAVVREGLASEDVEVRRVAVEAAVAGRVREATGDLREIASGAVDLELRRQALGALGALADREAVPLLVEYLAGKKGSSPEDRAAAAQALLALGERDAVLSILDGNLGSADEGARWTSLLIMAHAPVAEAVPELARTVAKGSARAERLAAAAALGAAASARAPGAMQALVSCLDERDAAVRAACAQAIAAAGVSSRLAFRKLLANLGDRDERVRAGAVLAAARLEPKLFSRELGRFGRERSPHVVAALAEALAEVPGTEAATRLVALAGSDEAVVRRRVVRSLDARIEPSALAALVELTDDPDLEVKRIAIGAMRDVELLARHLGAGVPEVRAAALGALVAARGRVATLPETARMLAEAPAEGSERVQIVRSWLAP
jgi:TonB family protein